jgi:hypothetical protein
MTRQSLDFLRDKNLPRYCDEEQFQRGFHYIFIKHANAAEPRQVARAVRKFENLGQALEWARSNLGADLYTIASI